MTEPVTVQLDESVLRDSQFSDVVGAIQLACPSQSQHALNLLEAHVQAYLTDNASSRFTAVKTAMLLLQVMLFVIRLMVKSIVQLDQRNSDLREEVGGLRTRLQNAELARDAALAEVETANATFGTILAAIPNDAIIQHLMATTAEIPAADDDLLDGLELGELDDEALDNLFTEDTDDGGEPVTEDTDDGGEPVTEE